MENELEHLIRTADGEPTQAREALEAVVRRYGGLVRGHARAILRDEHAADDVSQAVFIMLAKKAGKLKRGVVLAGWLHNATRFACLAYSRQAARRSRHEAAASALRPEGDGSLEPAHSLETQDAVHHAISALSTSDREALLLRHVEGLAVPAVAARLGLSEPAAKKRLARAIERVRAAVGLSEPRTPVTNASPPAGAASTDLITATLSATPVSADWASQIASNAFHPSHTASATSIAKGAEVIMKTRKFIAIAIPASTAVVITSSVLAVWASTGGLGFELPVAVNVVAQTPSTPQPPTPVTSRPATQRPVTGPGDAFVRLATAARAADDKAALDCFVLSGDLAASPTAGFIRLSSAQTRLGKAWLEAFGPNSNPPRPLGMSLGEALTPIAMFLSMPGQHQRQPPTDEITVRLADLRLPLPQDNPAMAYLNMPIKLKRIDGLWRFDMGEFFQILPIGTPPNELKETPAFNRHLVTGMVDAMNGIAKAVREKKFADEFDARAAFDDALEMAIFPIKPNGFDIGPAKP